VTIIMVPHHGHHQLIPLISPSTWREATRWPRTAVEALGGIGAPLEAPWPSWAMLARLCG
jgi:hypothetical protein